MVVVCWWLVVSVVIFASCVWLSVVGCCSCCCCCRYCYCYWLCVRWCTSMAQNEHMPAARCLSVRYWLFLVVFLGCTYLGRLLLVVFGVVGVVSLFAFLGLFLLVVKDNSCCLWFGWLAGWLVVFHFRQLRFATDRPTTTTITATMKQQ